MPGFTDTSKYDNLTQVIKLKHETECYGLPYGVFGLVCWGLTLISIILTYVNIPLISPWRWGKKYKRQKPAMLFISAVTTIGPVIYTGIACRADWMSILMAIGQLTPWSLKIANDGYVIKVDDGLEGTYRAFGFTMTILLYIVGWLGLEMAFVDPKTNSVVVIVTMIGLVICLLCYTYYWALMHKCLHTCCSIVIFYILMTSQIVGSHIILALLNKNWSGIAPDGAGQASAIIFFIGKRLLFLDLDFN
ncbi:5765_t:CDS:2 [Ambispora gerdemannii]|uniref:5765_t:CDS:1 n=1 Tax=Ambispora gerdemannii TaxID=144530 RepID=A0A9N9G8K9_9GLOM|nr:5765_t:CDS:2 [Ambispora gerdemannii]